MKLSVCLFQIVAIIFLISTVSSQPMIREKRRIRDALRKVGNSALSSFGQAAGSALGSRVGNAKFGRRG